MAESADEAETIRQLQRLRAGETALDPSLQAQGNALFERYRHRVRAYCRRRVGRDAQAEELANDVLLVAWRRLPDFDHSGSFLGWLLGIARFTCLRANDRREELLVEDEILQSTDPAASAWRVASRKERSELLQAAIDGLSDEQQRAIIMRYYEGAPLELITETLSLTNASGARGVLQTCKRHLERRLREVMVELRLDTSFWRSSRDYASERP
ncbi:MAG: sigma-70 family RNA polymerase sigma factor [Myxococcota bacterium]